MVAAAFTTHTFLRYLRRFGLRFLFFISENTRIASFPVSRFEFTTFNDTIKVVIGCNMPLLALQ